MSDDDANRAQYIYRPGQGMIRIAEHTPVSTAFARVLVDPAEWTRIQAELAKARRVSTAAWSILNTSQRSTDYTIGTVEYNLLEQLRAALQSEAK